MNRYKSTIRFDDLPDNAFIRLRHLLALQLVPYSATTLWRKCRRNEFPKPVKVSAGITAWRVGEIRRHINNIGKHKSGEAL
jgi:predicted DNA-binding transcriptional regulator AlpA